MHFPHCPKCTVTLNIFKLRYLKNLKLLLIKFKKIIEPIVLQRNADVFLPFFKHFIEKLIFRVTVGNFTVETQN